MFRPLVLALSLSIIGGLAAETVAADPPRILGSHIRDHDDRDRGRDRDGDRDRGRDHDRDRDDRRHDRDGRQHVRDDDHRDRWRDHDRHDRRHDRRHERYDRYDRRYDRRHDRRHDNDRYSFGLFLGSPWLGDPYYYDDYPRYRDDCRIVYRTRYDRWGRAYRERVRECYDRRRGYWSAW
jgi:hypothetical protein